MSSYNCSDGWGGAAALLFFQEVKKMKIDMVKIGQEAKAARVACGLTQEDIAIRTGYTVSHISMFETGKTKSLPLFLFYRRLGLDISLKEVFMDGEKND